MPEAAAIYARISQDRAGDGLGVARQVEDCQAEAERRGWPVAEVYIDDDISAYSGRRRPDYERMMADIIDGSVDAVIVWHLDRLHRRPKELEEFVEGCEAAGMRDLATVHGEVSIGDGDGLLVARIMAAVAANESDAKSRRVRRKMEQNAKAGKPHGGVRPFGYEPDRVTLRADEAAVIRTLADRLLAGERLQSLCRWLEDQAVPTATGKSTWRTSTLRNILRSGRISGQREHRGEIIGDADWPAIITPEQTERIRAILDDPARRTNRTARRYLLAGMMRCHACDATLVSHPRNGTRRYVCKTGADFDGCGTITINADRVEELIVEAVLYRLDTPELAAALTGKASDSDRAAALTEQIEADETHLEELAGLYADKKIQVREWIAARDPIEARLKDARRTLARLNRATALDGFIGHGEQLRATWSTLNLDRQRASVAALLDHAVIGPGTYRFDPGRVTPLWRL